MTTSVLTIDFETFYSKEYSLTKMTTQEYIQSPYFECIGVSVAKGANAAEWFSGTHAETKAWLSQFDWANSIAVAHNALFDGAILEWIFDLHPKQWFCTMSGAMPILAPFTPNGRVSLATVAKFLGLPDKGTEVMQAIGFMRRDFSASKLKAYGLYCCHDTHLAYQVFQHLAPKLTHGEHALIHETIRKFTRPILRLNRDVLVKRLAIVKRDKASALLDAGLLDSKSLMSNPLFAEALENMGIDPPMKISPTTGKATYAFAKTDAGMKALLEHPDPRVQYIVAARVKLKSTLEETRIEKFIRLANLNEPIGIPLRYYGAHTGRFSGSDGLNMQNLPRAGDLRRALEAPPGYKIVAADLSQIEARITAWFADELKLLTGFANNEDVYCEFATIIYGRPITKADKDERFMGKTAILGLGYGMGAAKFKETVRAQSGIIITLNEAKRIVRMYRKTYPGIPKLWSKLDSAMSVLADTGTLKVGPVTVTKGQLQLPNGMSIFYPDIEYNAPKFEGYSFRCKRMRRGLWGGTLTENIGQAIAKIILSIAEIRLAKLGLHAVMQVHDELLFCVKDEHVDRVIRAAELALSAPVSFMPGLPVACEVAVGDNYAEAK
tara:strand:- start:1386 stop:3209 length:1824 start_codon:yes stop_codon:yes gene_type:complete